MSALIQDPVLKAVIDRMPVLANMTNISFLEGGLTNKNYRVSTREGDYVLRISDCEPGLLNINRENEIVNSGLAWQAGVAPAVLGSIVDEGVLLISWINARTLHATDMRTNGELLKRMAGALQMLHGAAAFRGTFHFPAVRRNYLNTVLANNYFIPEKYLELEGLIVALEQALSADPETLVPCNNDLLAENFMDDGDKIWIIDYEYSGQNEPSFEIGNLAAESGLSEQDLTTLCEAYWKGNHAGKVARARAWSMISRFGWVLWASIQEAVSKKDFDFRSWGMKKWNSVLPELTGEHYYNILKAIKQ
jgi:thiamine kinase-like enzyme